MMLTTVNNRLDKVECDANWFYIWARNKGCSTRLINVVKRGMYIYGFTLHDICSIEDADNLTSLRSWKGMGVGTFHEFKQVFEDLKVDWGKEEVRRECGIYETV